MTDEIKTYQGEGIDVNLNDFTSLLNTTPFVETEITPSDLGSGTFTNIVGTDINQVLKITEYGFQIGNQTFSLAPFSVTMGGVVVANSLTLTGGTMKYGKTSFTDSTNAGYFISALGIYVGSAGDTTKFKYTLSDETLNYVGAISGRSTATIASAIDISGHFADSVFDTATKTILSDFTFGASGALQIGTYEVGVSGDIRISPTGILGRDKNNKTTFSIDATTGDAIFGGTLSAPSGTLGTITSATIISGNIDIQYLSGTNLLIGNDAEKATNLSSSPELSKEIKVYRSGTLYISYDMYGSGGGTAITNIYRNGVAVGTQRSNADGIYQTYTETITDWSKGDAVQIYIWKTSGSFWGYVRNFRLYADNPITETSTVE